MKKITATKEVILIADQRDTRRKLTEHKCDFAENEFDGTIVFTIHDFEDFIRHEVEFNGFSLSW